MIVLFLVFSMYFLELFIEYKYIIFHKCHRLRKTIIGTNTHHEDWHCNVIDVHSIYLSYLLKKIPFFSFLNLSNNHTHKETTEFKLLILPTSILTINLFSNVKKFKRPQAKNRQYFFIFNVTLKFRKNSHALLFNCVLKKFTLPQNCS